VIKCNLTLPFTIFKIHHVSKYPGVWGGAPIKKTIQEIFINMNARNRKLKGREIWIKTYQELGSVSKAARRCGIPRSTLYRWINRYKEEDKNSLKDRSQKPKKLAKQKITSELNS